MNNLPIGDESIHTERHVIGLFAAAAGGVQTIRTGFVEPAIRRGWDVAVTLTPTAGVWLSQSGERERIEQLTGLVVRDSPRLPDQQRPHPAAECYVVAPATANTVAKLALGVADNQGLTAVCEAIGDRSVPVIVFPRVNAAHARHPAWKGHIATLEAGGVHLVYGEHVWPLHEPNSAPSGRQLPWEVILARVGEILGVR